MEIDQGMFTLKTLSSPCLSFNKSWLNKLLIIKKYINKMNKPMVTLFSTQCFHFCWMNPVYLFMLHFSTLVCFGLEDGHASLKFKHGA
jgi:hypothetical protein